MEKRIILLLDMDAFFPAIEQRENPQFRKLPVVVGAEPKQGKGRGVVSSASYEARKYGIRSAMPISQAYKLCPHAVFLPVDMELYQKVSERIMEVIRKMCGACLVEQVSLDEAYVDMSLFSAIAQNKTKQDCWKAAEKLAHKLRAEIFKQERLTCSIGIGPNKMVAKIACEKAKPSVRHLMSNTSKGVFMVKPQEAQLFLDPLPIQKIPGVGLQTALRLQEFLGKKELLVSSVKNASRQELENLLGAHGASLYERIRGIDEGPVVAEHEIKSIGKEHTFEKDTRDGEEILSVFKGLAEEVMEELSLQHLSCKTITVVCRFQGFETHTKSKTLKEASSDGELFLKEAIRLLLRFLVEHSKSVRLVGVRAANLD